MAVWQDLEGEIISVIRPTDIVLKKKNTKTQALGSCSPLVYQSAY